MGSKFNVVFPIRLRPEHVTMIERAAAACGDCPSALVRRGGLAEARRVLRGGQVEKLVTTRQLPPAA